MSIEDIAQFVTIAATLSGGIYYTVLAPFKIEIGSLRDILQELKDSIESGKEDRRKLDARLTAAETSLKSAHKRIDKIEEKLEDHLIKG